MRCKKVKRLRTTSTSTSTKKSEDQAETAAKYLERTEAFRYIMGIPIKRGIKLWTPHATMKRGELMTNDAIVNLIEI